MRFKATTGSLVVTPAVAIVIPTSDYARFAHSATGRHVVEGQFGVSVGRLLDPMLPNAYIQARYMYTRSGEGAGHLQNRSDVFVDVGYLVTSSLTVSAMGFWQGHPRRLARHHRLPPALEPELQVPRPAHHDQVRPAGRRRLLLR